MSRKPSLVMEKLRQQAERWAYLLVKGIVKTLRLERRGWDAVWRLVIEKKQITMQVWHGDMFIAFYYLSIFRPAAIVSQHGDGEIASSTLERFGFYTFRGSSTRGGREAFAAMLRHLSQREMPVNVFAADGPRGPRRQLKPGILAAASRTDGYIVPIAMSSKYALRAKSWDRFFVPIPFSKARIWFGEPIKIPPRLSRQEFNNLLEQINATCVRLQEQADRYTTHD